MLFEIGISKLPKKMQKQMRWTIEEKEKMVINQYAWGNNKVKSHIPSFEPLFVTNAHDVIFELVKVSRNRRVDSGIS